MTGGVAAAAAPAAFLSVTSLAPAPGALPAVAGGHFKLTPDGAGFVVSSSADFASRANAARFALRPGEVQLDLANPAALYEIGSVEVTNGGLLQPTGAGMALVPIRGSAAVAVKGASKPAAVPLDFRVTWSLGSPSPVNTAGIFALVTRQPPPAFNFALPASPGGKPQALVLKLVGFKADAHAAAAVKLLGDWGQPDPKPGEAGPRAYVKEGAGAQVLKLFATVTKA